MSALAWCSWLRAARRPLFCHFAVSHNGALEYPASAERFADELDRLDESTGVDHAVLFGNDGGGSSSRHHRRSAQDNLASTTELKRADLLRYLHGSTSFYRSVLFHSGAVDRGR